MIDMEFMWVRVFDDSAFLFPRMVLVCCIVFVLVLESVSNQNAPPISSLRSRLPLTLCSGTNGFDSIQLDWIGWIEIDLCYDYW